MNKLKVAVVGCGSISSLHIESYLALENVELYALCDIDETRVKKKGEKYGVTRLYTDEAEMLKELPEIDLVSVCVWNCAHAPCAIMALNAGKHVLVEKPMATTVEEGLAMQEAAKKNNRLLMIAFVRRYGLDCDIVKNFIANDQVGEMYYAKACYLRRNGNPGGWFCNVEMSGGGPVIDIGVHVIDLVRYLLGNPKPVSVYGVTFNKLGSRRHSIKNMQVGYASAGFGINEVDNCEDMASALIRFDNGAVLNVEVSFDLNTPDSMGIQLFGTKAGVHVNEEGVKLYSENSGYLTNITMDGKTKLDVKKAFQTEIAHFVAASQGEVECISPAEDGIELMKILTAIYRSAKSGHEEVIQ